MSTASPAYEPPMSTASPAYEPQNGGSNKLENIFNNLKPERQSELMHMAPEMRNTVLNMIYEKTKNMNTTKDINSKLTQHFTALPSASAKITALGETYNAIGNQLLQNNRKEVLNTDYTNKEVKETLLPITSTSDKIYADNPLFSINKDDKVVSDSDTDTSADAAETNTGLTKKIIIN